MQFIRDTNGLIQTLRQRREALGWTQRHLAAQSGVAEKHISRIENGTHEPGISTVLALFSALGLDLALTGRDSAAPSIQDIF